jgi:hypothetical protein
MDGCVCYGDFSLKNAQYLNLDHETRDPNMKREFITGMYVKCE